MDILIMVGQLVLGLSILVGLHELGHLLAAKMFGMRVEQFSIGFPPKIFGVKYGETEYSIGAIPLGGYVKISGMVDESLDTEGLSNEPQPWEFRSKPAWQRLIVMLGGIIVNVITGIIIFVTLTYVNGWNYLSPKEAVYGLVPYGPAKEVLHLQTGDKIVAINGKPYKYFSEVKSSDVFLQTNSYYTVERNGQLVDIKIPNDFISVINTKENKGKFDIQPVQPFNVGNVVSKTAIAAGLKKGDHILAVNNKEVRFFHEFQEELALNHGRSIALQIKRGEQTLSLKVPVDKEGKIGFNPEPLLNYTHVDYTLGESISKGTDEAFKVVFDNIRGFGKIFRGEIAASDSVTGIVGIAEFFGPTFETIRFWSLLGMLSMALAFMNLLPIPALDGGHVTFLLYEIISGKSPSDKFLEVSQKIGMALLLCLMVFTIFNDIFKRIF